jgi:tRNA-Thr(GGU) m(6)t(6)A37 methyltransferase TsaA
VLNSELTGALDEIETFDHVWLIWVFDRNLADGYQAKVYPRPDPGQLRGLFVTRSPHRPNPIGLTCVKVIGREKNILKFENPDILDNSPLLDIKPYIPLSDSRPDSKAGWIDNLAE